MRFLKIFVLSFFLPVIAFSQQTSSFEFKGRFDFDNPEQRIKIHRFFDNGRKLLLIGNATYQIWDVENNRTVRSYPNPISRTHRVSELVLSPDLTKIIAFNPLVNTAEDDFLTVWDLESGEQLKSIDKDTYPTNIGFWSSDGRTLITSSDPDFATPYGYRYGGGGELVGNQVGEIKVSFWDAATLMHKNTITLENLTWRYISPDGRVLLTTSGPKRDVLGIDYASEKAEFIDVWNTGTGKLVKRLPIGDDVFFTRTRKLGVSPGGEYLALVQKSRKRDSDDRILVWKIDDLQQISAEPVYQIQADPKFSDSDITYSPDGKLMAIEAGKFVQIYEVATGRKQLELRETEMPSIWTDTVFLDIGAKKLRAYDIGRDKKIYEQELIYETSTVTDGLYMTDVNGNDISSKSTVIEDCSQFGFNLDENLYLTYSKRFLEVYDLRKGRLVATLVSPDYNFKKKKYDKEPLVERAGWETNGNLIYAVNPRGTALKIWKYTG